MLPVLVSDAILCGAFARRDAASFSSLSSALASALVHILAHVLACDDDAVALLVELRDPTDKAGRLLLCAVTAHGSGCSTALLLSQFDTGDVRLYLGIPLLATARVDLMGNGVLALKSDGQAAYFKVSSILTLWTTAQSLIALRDGGGPGGAPAALLMRPEKKSGVGEELGVDSHDAVEVIGDGLFDMAVVLPPTPTKAGVYRKPETQALEVRARRRASGSSPAQKCISKFIKGAPQPDEITVAGACSYAAAAAAANARTRRARAHQEHVWRARCGQVGLQQGLRGRHRLPRLWCGAAAARRRSPRKQARWRSRR